MPRVKNPSVFLVWAAILTALGLFFGKTGVAWGLIVFAIIQVCL